MRYARGRPTSAYRTLCVLPLGLRLAEAEPPCFGLIAPSPAPGYARNAVLGASAVEFASDNIHRAKH